MDTNARGCEEAKENSVSSIRIYLLKGERKSRRQLHFMGLVVGKEDQPQLEQVKPAELCPW